MPSANRKARRAARQGGVDVPPASAPASVAPSVSPATASMASGGYFGYYPGNTSYFAAQADVNGNRGDLVLPNKDIRTQLNASARTVMALKSRVLMENYGPFAALWNLAGWIGSMTCSSLGGDTEYDKVVDAYYNSVVFSPLRFDACGVDTLRTYQRKLLFGTFIDGDAFTVFANSQSGHGQIAGYDGLSVEQPQGADASWYDGIQTNDNRFALAFNFVERNLRTGFTTDRPLPSSAVFHHVATKGFGARRASPILSTSINDAIDCIEVKGFLKKVLKVASMIGLTPAEDPQTVAGSPFSSGVAGTVWSEPTTPPGSVTAAAGAVVPETRVNFEEGIAAGIVSTKPYKVVHDDRPHPNGQEFFKGLWREACQALGVPPSIMYFMDDPSGTNSRVQLQLLAGTIAAIHRDMLAPFLRRQRLWVISQGLKLWTNPPEGTPAKTLGIPPPPRGGAAYDFTACRLTPPKSFTADAGREGRIQIELRKHQMTTYARIYEELGVDWREGLRQCAEEIGYLRQLEKQIEGLQPGDLTSNLLGTQPGAAPAADADPAAMNRP